MKGKVFKMVTAVVLSAFLAVTTAVCPAKAASDTDNAGCQHRNVTETYVTTYYPNADRLMHQAADVYNVTCDLCSEDLGQITRKYNEYHSFGADRKCTKCHFDGY